MLPDHWQRELEAALEEVQRVVNDELAHQFGQLGESLRDFFYDLFNYPLERPWPESLAIFAEHWTDRGLRLTPRTLDALGQLIAEELGDAVRVSRADGMDAFNSDRAPPRVELLAAAPRPGGQRGKRRPAASKPTGPPPAMPFGKRLPAGKWIKGTEGNGTFRLETPIRLSTGEIVKEIDYEKGLPIFDKWAVKGEDVVVAITGDHDFDGEEARKAWRDQTGKMKPKANFVFHHDGLTTEVGRYKGQTIFTGRMQLVPEELNGLPHIGSASMARRLTLDKNVARDVNRLAMRGKGPLGAIRKRLASQATKRLKSLGKAIPIIGGAVSLVFIAEDVEAHGAAGAIVRATPLLGDVVDAYDLGKELADYIREEAEEKLQAVYAATNDPVQLAHTAADRQAAAVFNELAKNIRVMQYMQSEEIVDAIEGPLSEFRGEVFSIYVKLHQNSAVGRPAGTPAGATEEQVIQSRMQQAKDKLKRELKRNFEKPIAPGPLS